MPDGWINTNELRRFRRAVPLLYLKGEDKILAPHQLTPPEPVLQQRWVLVGTAFSDELTDKNSEWRDVPLVEEAAKGTNVVACGCGWSGQQDGLVETAGVRSCPDCGAAFNSYRLEHHPSGVKF